MKTDDVCRIGAPGWGVDVDGEEVDIGRECVLLEDDVVDVVVCWLCCACGRLSFFDDIEAWVELF